jgi:hypothetical protein
MSWLLGGVVLAVFVGRVFGVLHFIPNAVDTRIGDYAIALLLLPVGLLGVFLLFRGVRWLLLAAWLRPVAISFNSETIDLSLGPYGHRRLDAGNLQIRYPFELSEDEVDDQVEYYLDEDVQVRELLPRMTHPQSPVRLDRLIERFTAKAPRQSIARRLEPFLRSARPDLEDVRAGDDSDEESPT